MMTAVVVMTVAVIASSVLSYEGPVDVPNVDIIGWVDVGANTVNFKHTGGEIVGGQDLRLNLNLNGSTIKLSSQDIHSIYGQPQWGLGDVISVNSSSLWGISINENDFVSSTVVHIPSNVVLMSGPLLGDEDTSSGILANLPQILISSGWPFNEANAETAFDSVNDNHGTVMGAEWTTGISGSGLMFHGNNDKVRVENDLSLNPDDEITIEAWVKWAIDPNNGENWAAIVNKGGDEQYQLQHTYGNSQFEFAVKTDESREWISSTTAPEVNKWYHVVGVYSSYDTELAIYVNGEKEKSATQEGKLVMSGAPLLIGEHYSSDRSFVGIIDEVWVYNTRLSDEQIRSRYDLNKPVTIDRAYWTFNENSGSLAADSIGSHDGDISGAKWVTGLNGSALEFDGINDHIEIDSSVVTNYPFTVSAWFKTSDSSQDQVIISMADSSASNAYYGLHIDKTKGLTLTAKNIALKQVSSDVDVSDGHWHYAVGVFTSPTDRKLYVDGVLNGTDTAPTPFNTDFDRWNIGSWADKSPASYFTGVIDEASVVDKALSASEIMALYLELRPDIVVVVPDVEERSLWKFNEGSGSGIEDSVGDNDGMLYGSAIRVVGLDGTALDINGGNDRVTVPDDSSLDLDSEGSIEAWVRLDNYVANGCIVYKGSLTDGSDKAYALEFDDARHVKLVGYNSAGTSQQTVSTTQLDDDKWYHVVGTWDSTSMDVYVNGVLDTTIVNNIGSFRKTAGTLQIGTKFPQDGSNKYAIDGTLDEVSVSNRKMNVSSVLSKYNLLKPAEVTPVGTSGYWALNENSGTNAEDSVDDNDGSIVGTSWATGVNGSALDLDGVDDTLVINDPIITKYPFTISAWIKTDTSGKDQAILSIADPSSTNVHYGLLIDDQTGISVVAKNTDLNKVSGNIDVADGKWHNVVGVFASETSRKLYVDGVLNASDTASVSFNENVAVWNAGRSATSTHGMHFDGIIDEIGIYNRTLTSNEVLDIYRLNAPVEVVPSVTELLAHWDFNEFAGSTAHDVVGNNDGSISGAGWSSGSNGTALLFDGKNDRVEVNKPIVSEYPFTVTAWFKLPSKPTSDKAIVSLGNSASSNVMYGLYYDKYNGISMMAKNTAEKTASSSVKVSDDEWHQAVGVFESETSRKLYVDGVLKDTDTSSSPFNSGTNRWNIGRWADSSPSSYFYGLIDEVRVYNGALSDMEVSQLYNDEKPAPKTTEKLFSWWRFEEGSGTHAEDSIRDNDGTLQNSATWKAGINGTSLDVTKGKHDYVRVPNDDTLYLTDEGTVEAWINIDDHTSFGGIVHKGNLDDWYDEAYTLQFWSGNKIYMGIRDEYARMSSVQSTTVIQKDQWYHVVGMWNESVVQVYINGELENTATNKYGKAMNSPATLQIGAQLSEGSNRYGLDGQLDEVRIYNWMLEPSDVKARYELERSSSTDQTPPDDVSEGGDSCWNLNEVSGSTASDSISGNDGSVSGAKWVAGVNGKALSFDGKNDYVNINDPVVSGYPFTVEAWFKTDQSKKDMVIASLADSGVTNSYYGIFVDHPKGISIRSKNTAERDLAADIDVEDNQWHHVVAVFASDNERRLYVDGALVATDTKKSSFNENVDRWNIGRWADKTPQWYYKGSIDEVCVYDRELTNSEIQAKYDLYA